MKPLFSISPLRLLAVCASFAPLASFSQEKPADAKPLEPAPAATAEEPAKDAAGYRQLTLASGLKLEAPKDWTAVHGSDSQPVEKVDAAFLKPQTVGPEGGTTTWLQAISPGNAGHASILIRTTPSSSDHPADPQALKPAELEKMKQAILKEESHALDLRRIQQLSDLKPVQIAGRWGLAYHYDLSALPGGEEDAADEVQFAGHGDELHLVFIYPREDAERWKAVFDRVRASIHFGAAEAAAASEGPAKKKR